MQVNVLLKNCKQNITSLSLFAGRTVVSFDAVYLLLMSDIFKNCIHLQGQTSLAYIMGESRGGDRGSERPLENHE